MRISGKYRILLSVVSALAALATASAAPVPVLHLQADQSVTADASGVVSEWDDTSGNANNALQGDPNLSPKLVNSDVNGKPAIRFDGDNDYMEVASAASLDLSGDVSSFFVVRFDDFDFYRAVWAKGNANFPAPLDYYLLPDSGIISLWRGDGSPSNSGNFNSSRGPRANAWVVLGFVISGNTVTHYINGQAAGSGDINVTPADGGMPLRIGTRDDLFTKFKGDMAELLIYDTALSGADLDSAITGLRQKYNILNDPPSVSITSPANNAVLGPGDFTLSATASDTDGKVTKIEFLANGGVIATATSAPFSIPVAITTPGTVVFTARATDDKDATTLSAPVSVQVAGIDPPPPPTTSANLKLWLKADAGVTTTASGAVSEWDDQSGNGNNAVMSDETTAPVVASSAINGKPSLRFDGVDDFLTVANSDSIAIAGDIASFFVVRFDDNAWFRAVWAKTSGNLPAPTDYYLVAGSGVPRFYRGDGAASLGSVDGAAPVPINTPVVLGFDEEGTQVSHFLNGQFFGGGELNAVPVDGGKDLLIGTRDDQVTRMKGDIAEILIYDSALDAPTRDQLSHYLAFKYGVPIIQTKNAAPAVTLTSPADGLSVTVPATITLSADASDANGSIARVDFYANGSVIASSSTAPYTATASVTTVGDLKINAVAVDNFGATTSSATVTVKAKAKVVLPIPADGLVLWLQADKGVTTDASGLVTKWEDSSGNLNDANQTTLGTPPTLVPNALGGKPVVEFNGDKDELKIEHSASVTVAGDISTFFVVRFADFDTFRAVWAQTHNNLPSPNDYYAVPGTGVPRVYRGHGTGSGLGSSDGTALPADTFIITGWDAAGKTVTHYLDNQVLNSSDINATLGDTGDPVLIGTRGDQFTRMKGDIAEIVIYNRTLPQADRDALHTYLRKKYGFPGGETPPSLTVSLSGKTLVLSWPSAAAGYDLEAAGQVTGAFAKVTEPIVPNGDQNTVSITTSDAARFFRLHKTQ